MKLKVPLPGCYGIAFLDIQGAIIYTMEADIQDGNQYKIEGTYEMWMQVPVFREDGSQLPEQQEDHGDQAEDT